MAKQQLNNVHLLVHSLLVMILALSLGACSSRTVKTTSHTPVIQETAEIPEEQLMDVSIRQFDPGIANASDDEDTIIFPEIRKAESRFMPYLLMETLQTSAAWGAVRVVPNDQNAPDVYVEGEIVNSDGELLELKVKVSDASGREWFTRNYKEMASRYAYDPKKHVSNDPFQGLYNRIANDMLTYRRENLSAKNITTVRTVAELKFAESFSPKTFDGHLDQDRKGRYKIKRLPAEGDPMLDRIRRIRERDYLFVDTLQDYYGSFVKEMEDHYQQWRAQSYDEVIAMKNMQREARNRKIMGVAAILGGIAAAGSDSGSASTAGQVAVAAGGYMVKSGFDKSAESKMHVEALQELGDSMEAQIEPQIIELEDRTITLSGTVENQYNQWREILRSLYNLETGEVSQPSSGESQPSPSDANAQPQASALPQPTVQP